MVKNLIGGNKAKGLSNKKHNIKKIKLFKKPNDFEYIGRISKEFGSARFETEAIIDNYLVKLNCSASRSIRIKLDDFVLITILRENKASKILQGEIVHKYDSENIADLKQYEENQAKIFKRESIYNRLIKSNVLNINNEIDDTFDFVNELNEKDIDDI
jgi:hypothetical protein